MIVTIRLHGFIFGRLTGGMIVAAALFGGPPSPSFAQEQSLCLVQKLTPPFGANEYNFGLDVAFSGDVAVVRAGSADCATPPCSALYIFRRDDAGTPGDVLDDAWVSEQKITFPDTLQPIPLNGGRTSISGDLIVAGALDDCAAGTNCGSAHVFRYSSGIWVEEQTLRPSNQPENNRFGRSTSVSGDYAFVGARAGADCGDGTFDCGAAHVYRYDGEEWIEEQKFTTTSYAVDGGRRTNAFGRSVAFAGGVAIVGDYLDGCADGGACGAVYAYRYNNQTQTWNGQKLSALDAAAGDSSGIRVAVGGDVAMAGAPYRDCADGGVDCGSVYAYTYNAKTQQWDEQILVPSDAEAGDWFGFPVSMDGDIAYVGAHGGDCTDGNNCGKAYVFRNDGGTWVEAQRLATSDISAVGNNLGAALACAPSGGVVGVVGSGSAGAAYVFQVMGVAECPCVAAAPPEIAQHDSNASASVALTDLRMNRYLGIRTPGSVGRSQAIQVEFVSLPPPWEIWNGTRMFVTEPTAQCEVAGVGRGQTCPPVAATFALSGLTCNVAEADFRDWTTLPGGVVYVTHPGIIPQPYPNGPAPTYEIKAIDITCSPGLEASYSAGTMVQQVRWGDLAGPFDSTGNYYTAPEGTSTSVSITLDITAALAKFGNRNGAPIKARADVEPCVADLKLNMSDVTRLLDAFRGIAYPFAPGQATFGCASLNPCEY